MYKTEFSVIYIHYLKLGLKNFKEISWAATQIAQVEGAQLPS